MARVAGDDRRAERAGAGHVLAHLAGDETLQLILSDDPVPSLARVAALDNLGDLVPDDDAERSSHDHRLPRFDLLRRARHPRTGDSRSLFVEDDDVPRGGERLRTDHILLVAVGSSIAFERGLLVRILTRLMNIRATSLR